jgi:hypothetical protein
LQTITEPVNEDDRRKIGCNQVSIEGTAWNSPLGKEEYAHKIKMFSWRRFTLKCQFPSNVQFDKLGKILLGINIF